MLEKVISPVRISYVTNGYSSVTQDTVLSPLVYLFCILIRLGSRSNNAVAKLSRQRSGILKQNEESTSSVFHFIWLCFYWKMSHNIYHMSSWATIPEYQPLNDTKALGCYVTRCWKPWRVMSPDAEGIGWHNAPGLSCHALTCYVTLCRRHITFSRIKVMIWLVNMINTKQNQYRGVIRSSM